MWKASRLSECGQNTPLATHSRDAFGWEAVYEKLKELHLGECAEHERTGRWVGRLVGYNPQVTCNSLA